jgi:hypothetical protein
MADAAAAASTVDAGAAAAANAGSWADTLDADTKPWVAGMGLDKLPADQALAKVLPMYRGAEQKLGVPADQVLRLPGKDAKPEEWRAVYSKLGTPDKPEGYEIQAPEGDSGEFLKTAVGWFHEIGLPKGMAQALTGKWGEYVAAAQEAEIGKWNARFDTEVAELKTTWGQDYDKHLDLSNRVLKAAGFSPDQQKAIEQALGPKAFRQAFAKFGSMVGEHRFVGGEGEKGFGMSPEGARERIKALQADKAWQTKYLNGDADAKAEFTRLQQIANPEQMSA